MRSRWLCIVVLVSSGCAKQEPCIGTTNGACDPGYTCEGPAGAYHCVLNPRVGQYCDSNNPGCGAGLVCHLTPNAACTGCPSSSGTCVGEAQEGQHCGGNIANPPDCAPGLTCRTTGLIPDAGGTCEK